jgi:hypothetical protein
MAAQRRNGLAGAIERHTATGGLKNGMTDMDIVPGRQPVEQKKDTGYQKNALKHRETICIFLAVHLPGRISS